MILIAPASKFLQNERLKIFHADALCIFELVSRAVSPSTAPKCVARTAAIVLTIYMTGSGQSFGRSPPVHPGHDMTQIYVTPTAKPSNPIIARIAVITCAALGFCITFFFAGQSCTSPPPITSVHLPHFSRNSTLPHQKAPITCQKEHRYQLFVGSNYQKVYPIIPSAPGYP